MNFKNFLFRITHWETWHYLVKYIPILPAWLWYCLRARSFWFFTPSNPTLTFGGFEGETKREMYNQLPTGSYPRSIYIPNTISFFELEKLLLSHQFQYPFAVKPDAGMMGFMFRKITNVAGMKLYHEKMSVDYIIQDLITYPLEVSVFYYRFPNQQTGTITGFLKKEFLEVTGDGKSTLWQLILNYPRVRFRLEEMKAKHAEKLDDIIPSEEIYCLSYALNLSRGGKLVSLAHEKDDRLLKVFDDISNYTKHFYYGRYDIKCTTIEDLKAGKNFSILEYNGCGAEPHHVYGNGNTLLKAYKILVNHWHILFKISMYNHKNGFSHWPFKKGWDYMKEARKNYRVIKQLDAETEL